MLPPVLEIYAVWHPSDTAAEVIARQLADHFHGTPYSGLMGGSVEVYVRSAPWGHAAEAPRPVPSSVCIGGFKSPRAQFLAIVPVTGIELARAVERDGPWRRYIEALVEMDGPSAGIFPYRLSNSAFDGTRLANLVAPFQFISGDKATRVSELAQAIAQRLNPSEGRRLTVFVSHTKHASGHSEQVSGLIETIRRAINETRLNEFFDASDLQPGSKWEEGLVNAASTSALLAVRTDMYSSRTWCQREILLAKQHGMPVVIADALLHGEERGSFLMDHVPRIPVRGEDGKWDDGQVTRALNLLVDECLKRAIWARQEKALTSEQRSGIAWWAPHAPEPVTLINWIRSIGTENLAKTHPSELLIMHPDPPLGPDELSIIQDMLLISRIDATVDVLTPRLFSARGA